MKKLVWWFRIVGVFYLLLTLMNLYGLFGGGEALFADTLREPMKGDVNAMRAFMDAWMVFVFEFGVLGAMALWAARQPALSRILAWTIIWAELFRGIVADAIWIAWGYDPVGYSIFIVIHLVIIATGVWALRSADSSRA